MKTVKTTLLITLLAFGLACGYSAKSTPPAAGTMPAIAQLNPNTATAGEAAFTLTVNGSNFGTKAVVNWNGAAQTATTTYVSSSQLTVTIPAAMIAASGTAQVTVTNPGTPGSGIYGTGATLAETSTAVDFTIN
jgi:IPT/TIG domain-containing protein